MDSKSLWPDRDAAQEGLVMAVDAVLAALSAEETDLILLRFEHRAPLREIGDIVGVSKDTVSRMLDTLLARIRTMILLLAEDPESYHDARASLALWVRETPRTIGERPAGPTCR